MKLWTSEHIFDHPWETVVHAAWRKYPNPMSQAVKSMDVTNRQVGHDGILRTKRIVTTEWSVPSWVTKLIGLENPSFAYEYSEVNPAKKEMVLKAQNVTCSSFVTVDETLVYKPHPENPQSTLLEQSCRITVRSIPLVDYMENLMASTISANAAKGRLAMEWVIGNLHKEYEGLSRKLSTSAHELSHNVYRGIDELRDLAELELPKTMPE